jgi:hypothetical protein
MKETNFTISHDSGLDACVVRVLGRHRRPGDSHHLMEVAQNRSRTHHCTRLLLDMRQADIESSVFDTFETIEKMPASSIEYYKKIAAVYKGDLDSHRFLETLAFNRGISGLRIFNNIRQAKEWLLNPVESYFIPPLPDHP